METIGDNLRHGEATQIVSGRANGKGAFRGTTLGAGSREMQIFID
ncbi:hypothetical protein [Paracoccus sp. PAR01]|nr:hypothetical protein [Paracoccus sp. PAR01]